MFDVCPICDLPKLFRSTLIGTREFKTPTWDGHEDCVIELERRRISEEQEQQSAWERRKLEDRLAIGFADSGVSWESKSIDNLRPNKGHKSAQDRVKGWVPGNSGFVLVGPPGCGKTHLLVGLAKLIAERDRLDFKFIKINPWLDSLRGIEFQQLERIVRATERVPLLFLDDLGAEKLTEWTESKIERVFDYRFEFQLPTFISTNLVPEALSKHLTTRLWSRLRGISEFVNIHGSDFRQTRGQK
jgi:DNA replication protein DnaC